MLHTNNQIIQHKVGLLNLAEELHIAFETLLDGKRIWAEKNLAQI